MPTPFTKEPTQQSPESDASQEYPAPPLQGMKFDQGKPRPELLPPLALMEISKVLAFGAQKYSAGNWRKVRGWRWRYTGAVLRHMFLYMSGNQVDSESGLSHLSHAGCDLLFLLELEHLCAPHGDEVPVKVT